MYYIKQTKGGDLHQTIMTNEQKQWLKEHLENDIKMSEYQLRTKETQVRNFEILKRTKNEKYLKLVNDTIPHIKNYIKMSSEILKTL